MTKQQKILAEGRDFALQLPGLAECRATNSMSTTPGEGLRSAACSKQVYELKRTNVKRLEGCVSELICVLSCYCLIAMAI